MRNITLPLAGVLLLGAGSLPAAEPAQASDDATAAQVQTLVSVNGKPVTNLHFAMFTAQAGRRGLASANPDDQGEQIAMLNELVNTYMVADSAEGRAYAQRADVAAALEVSRITLVAQGLIRDRMQNAEVDPARVQAVFDERYGGVPGIELKARHILLDTEENAAAVIAQLEGGADFAELAKEKSTGPSGKVGGDLGWFAPGDMVDAFSEAAQGLAKGEHSKQPVKTEFGWHVILLEDKRDVPVPTLDDVRAEIETELRREAVTRMVQDIRDRTSIDINRADGSKEEPAAD